MNLIGWIISAALVLMALFVVANWTLITAPASLNFLAFTIEGPLGLILLAATVFLVVLCVAYALSVRTAALIENRKFAKELAEQRAVAENAEVSRISALAQRVDQQSADLRGSVDALRSEIATRVADLESALRTVYTEHANAIFANIGEVDDKLTRLAPRTDGERNS